MTVHVELPAGLSEERRRRNGSPSGIRDGWRDTVDRLAVELERELQVSD